MKKVAILYNTAPHYRTAIFKKIDEVFNPDWYFSLSSSDIKDMDYTVLRNVRLLSEKKIGTSNWYWQKDALSLGFGEKYDIILALGDPYCISTWLLALKCNFFSKKKIYFWTHGWYGKEGKLNGLIKKIFFKLADRLFLYGNRAKKLMIQEGFNENRLHVIHNSLDYKIQKDIITKIKKSDIYINHFGNHYPTLIFIGRLTKVKRLDILLEAVYLLHKGHKPVNVIFVGDGSEKEELIQLSKKYNIDKFCWFYGASYSEGVNAELIYNADICVAPGNVGLTAIHSMAYGTPVISHCKFEWQMPEFEAIVPDVTGCFFEKDNVRDLKRSISNWIDKHPDREAVRKACICEIELNWTPEFQIKVLKENFDL